MEGYIYIARIIDHGGKFVNGYHKIGLSKQYKVRETQLNSTHLPFDVLMVRVFEVDDMKQLEGLLHLCFEDYRVVKEYDYRRNITTEWFDVSDIDVFNERLDKFVDLMGIDEVDMDEGINNDSTLTDEEKNEVKKNVTLGRSTLRRDANYEFWTQFLNEYKKVDSLYDNISPLKESWISKRLKNVGDLNCVISGTYSRVELYINIFNIQQKEGNKNIFNKFYSLRDQIEDDFGYKLKWNRMDEKRACRVSFEGDGNIYDKEKWGEMTEFMKNNMIKFSNVIKKYSEIV